MTALTPVLRHIQNHNFSASWTRK